MVAPVTKSEANGFVVTFVVTPAVSALDFERFYL
jgi:hypothetical protein